MYMPVNVRKNAYYGSCNDAISLGFFMEFYLGKIKERGKSRNSPRFIELKRFIIMIIRAAAWPYSESADTS
jgi:hypothetical protein